MIKDLQPDSFGDDAIVETAVALPHMPKVVVTGVVPSGCRVFKSALLPFALRFTVESSSTPAAAVSVATAGGLSGGAASKSADTPTTTTAASAAAAATATLSSSACVCVVISLLCVCLLFTDLITFFVFLRKSCC